MTTGRMTNSQLSVVST